MWRVNLLPWRAQQRARRVRKLWYGGGAVVVLLCVVWMLTHATLSQTVLQQRQRNAGLQQALSVLQAEAARDADLSEKWARLQVRWEAISTLFTHRSEMLDILEAVPALLPEAAYLTKLQCQEDRVFFTGLTASYASISHFMRNLGTSPHFTAPHLRALKSSGVSEEGPWTFHVEAVLTPDAAFDSV